jgi:membrane protein
MEKRRNYNSTGGARAGNRERKSGSEGSRSVSSMRAKTTPSDNAKQKGSTISQSSSEAAGVSTARHNTARHNKAIELRGEVTIPSYSRRVIINAPRLYLVEAGKISRFLRVLRAALVATVEDNSLSIAKGAAYSSLLSFFPVLTTLAALLVQANATNVARTIANFLYEVVPPGTEDVVLTLFVVHGERPRYLLVSAVVLALWAASGAMMSIIEGFRSIYRIPSGRSFVRERAMAIFLVLVCTAPIVGASALIVFGTRTESFLMHRLGVVAQDVDVQGWVELFSKTLRLGLAFASFVLVTVLLYYLGPNRKQTFANVFPGAVLATVLWLISTLAFSWYVRHISNYNVLYGSVGAGLALLVWMYVWSVITLIGCEYNAARERLMAEPTP